MTRLFRLLASAACAAALTPGSPALAQVRASTIPKPLGQSATIPAGSIQGIVIDEHGAPLAGATVSAFGTTMAFAVSDRVGAFALRPLSPGPYIVRAHLPGFAASRREMVNVTPSGRAVLSPQLRRLSDAVGTSGELQARPILAAGMVAAPPGASEGGGSDSNAELAGDSHGETAWRLRHLKRSVLRETTDYVEMVAAADPNSSFVPPGVSLFGKAMESSARLAASLFTEFPFSGQFNLLTTSSFDSPQDLFAGGGLPQGIAFVSIGAPAGQHGDWSVNGAMTQGDVSSWILAGSYTNRGPNTAHAYDIGMSYATQRYDGGNPMALAAVTDGARNAGAIYAADIWTLSPRVSLGYGARYSRYDYLTGDGLWSPRLSVTLSATAHTRLRATASQRRLAPGAEEFLPPPVSGVWLPPERTFAPASAGAPFRAERARHVEIGLEHDVAGAYVVGVRRFHQNIDHQLVTLFGLRVVDERRSDLGHYYVGDAGSASVDGWTFSLSHAVARRLRGSIDYTIARAHWAPSPEADLIATWAPSAVRQGVEDFHDVTTSLVTEIPETATRLFLVYRVNTAFTRDDDQISRPTLDGRFDVQVNQSLPFMHFTNTDWEVLVAVRNLFRETAAEGSAYDELLVVRPPKRIVGGLMVRF